MFKHLAIHQGTHFEGFPINISNGPLVRSYLEKTYSVLNQALLTHPRTIIFHAVLSLPQNYDTQLYNPKSISRFIASFKEQVEADQARRLKSGKRVHKTEVGYTWCREKDSSSNYHYHIFILMNGDSYRSFGSLVTPEPGQLFYMLNAAWCRAINIYNNGNCGLVHLTTPSPVYVNANEANFDSEYDKFIGKTVCSFESVFYWMSYIAKLETKCFVDGNRNFGCSQNKWFLLKGY